MPRIKTIEWKENSVVIVDQTILPLELHYKKIDCIESMYDAIKVLKVRGAPAIGIAAAFGLYLGIRDFPESGSTQEFIENLNSKAAYLAGSRPTAVNLFWALERIKRTGEQSIEKGASIEETKDRILSEAIEILEEDRRTGRAIGEAGLELLKGKKNNSDTLQCGRTGHGRVWNRTCSCLCWSRAGNNIQCLCR